MAGGRRGLTLLLGSARRRWRCRGGADRRGKSAGFSEGAPGEEGEVHQRLWSSSSGELRWQLAVEEVGDEERRRGRARGRRGGRGRSNGGAEERLPEKIQLAPGYRSENDGERGMDSGVSGSHQAHAGRWRGSRCRGDSIPATRACSPAATAALASWFDRLRQGNYSSA